MLFASIKEKTMGKDLKANARHQALCPIIHPATMLGAIHVLSLC